MWGFSCPFHPSYLSGSQRRVCATQSVHCDLAELPCMKQHREIIRCRFKEKILYADIRPLSISTFIVNSLVPVVLAEENNVIKAS